MRPSRTAQEWRGEKCSLPFSNYLKLFIHSTFLHNDGTVIPYLKMIKKYINHVNHLLISADISIFWVRISRTLMHILLHVTFFEILKVVLVNMKETLMMPANFATPEILKIKVSWKKVYADLIPAWRPQKSFILWLKLCCRCGHVTKVW